VISEIEISAALELFEAAPCAYLFTLPDGTITRVNQTFLDWMGYDSSELVHRKKFQELLTRPSAIFYETHFSPLLRMQGFVNEITVDFLCVDGSHLPALVNSKIQANESGDPALILTSIFDIRERRRYERELLLERQRAEQWAWLVENTSDAIVAANAQSILTGWNRGAEVLFGYKAAEAIGQSFRDLMVPPEGFETFNASVQRLRSGRSVQHEGIVKDNRGAPIHVSINMTPLIEPVDDYKGFAAIMRDVRARKKSERAQRMARDLALANSLAHQINNPLQAVTNCLAIVSYSTANEYVSLAEENLKRIAQVITDLAAVTRRPQ
jgi:PAS domain S-box-containing protein